MAFPIVFAFIASLTKWNGINNMVPTGGLNNSAAAVVFYLYQKAFESRQMGYASAMAFLLAIIIFIVTAINFKGQDKWVKEIS